MAFHCGWTGKPICATSGIPIRGRTMTEYRNDQAAKAKAKAEEKAAPKACARHVLMDTFTRSGRKGG